MGIRKKIAFSFVATFLLVFLLEIFFRISGAGRIGAEKFYENIFDPFTCPRPGMQNPYSDFEEFVNKAGLGGPDFERKKPKGLFRIICLGDSTTYGACSFENSYPLQLEKILNHGRADKRIEVINAGLPGTSIYQQRMIFKKVFEGTEPDMVLLMTGPNWRQGIKEYRNNMKKPSFLMLRRVKLALARFAVYRVIRRIIKGGVDESILDDSEIAAEHTYLPEQYLLDYRQDLSIFGDLARQRGFELVFLGSFEQHHIAHIQNAKMNPDDPEYVEEVVTRFMDREAYEFATKWGFHYIDLTQDFVRAEDPDHEGLWADRHHPGPYGNRLIAQRTARELLEKDILPKQ